MVCSSSVSNICNLMCKLDINLDTEIKTMIEKDASIIVYCMEHELPSMNIHYITHLNINRLYQDVNLKKRFYQMYPDEACLYKHLYNIIHKMIPSRDFLDIIPLIDEYIEHAFSMFY